jgi:hypothetical protein
MPATPDHRHSGDYRDRIQICCTAEVVAAKQFLRSLKFGSEVAASDRFAGLVRRTATTPSVQFRSSTLLEAGEGPSTSILACIRGTLS